MSRYQAYAEYKDSGVEWLGDIPADWQVSPLKWHIARNDGGVWGDDPDGVNDTIVLRSTEQTMDGFWKMDDPAPRKLSIRDKAFALLQLGDLLVTKSSGSSLHIGKTTLVTEEIAQLECCYSNFMQRIRVQSTVHSKLAWYLMNNELSRSQLDYLSNTTTGLANLNGTMLGELIFALPTFAEQEKIANFLDHETAKIDLLIEKQQALIELLKEKRLAIISHAVTKGLNPNAPMKDSGVEWLGEVPEHWTLPKIKWFFRTESGGTPNTAKYEDYYLDGDIPWIRTTDLNNSDLYETPVSITEKAVNESACSLLPVNSVLIAMYGGAGSIGKHSLLKFESTINQAVCAILPNPKIHPEFLHLYVEFYRPYWMVGAEGTRKDPNINQDVIRELTVPCPTEAEQVDIVEMVKEKLAKIDLIIEKSELNIECMQERRTALISAAVTGKIDVRDWQAPGNQGIAM